PASYLRHKKLHEPTSQSARTLPKLSQCRIAEPRFMGRAAGPAHFSTVSATSYLARPLLPSYAGDGAVYPLSPDSTAQLHGWHPGVPPAAVRRARPYVAQP